VIVQNGTGGGGSGTVTSVATGCGLSGGTITTSGTIVSRSVANAQIGTTYTLDAGDCGKLVTLSNGSPVTLTVPAAGGSFVDGWYVDVQNIGVGTATCSGATCTLTTGQSARFVSTGSTWRVLLGGGTTGGTGYATIEVGGSAQTQRTTVNFIAGTGATVAGADAAPDTNVTISADTAVMLSRATGQGGTDNTCIPTSASGTTFTCSMVGNALTAYTNGMRVMFRPDVTLSGSPTLNINTLGAKNLYAADGTTAATGTAGLSYWLVYNSSLNGAAGGWVFPATGGGGVSSVSGTTNEITSTGGATPVLSLSSTMDLTSKTVRVPNSTSLPGTCTVGDSYMDTNATSGARWFLCESTNTWVAQGGSAGSALDGITYTPFGSMSTSTATTTMVSANMVVYQQFPVFAPGMVVNRYKFYTTGAAQGNMAVALYDSGCNLIANSTVQFASAASNASLSGNLSSPLTLTPGLYFVAYTSDVTTTRLYGTAGDFGNDPYDSNESTSTRSAFKGANASTGTTPLTFPATCGNRNPNTGGTALWNMSFR